VVGRRETKGVTAADAAARIATSGWHAPTVEASEVLEILAGLDGLGVRYWLDGGWGVDCLLGEQSRPHRDLDVVLPRPELERTTSFLVDRAFAISRDWLPTSLAFRDPDGLEVDLHPVDATPDGGGNQVLQDGTVWHYAPPVEGTICGKRARCASAEDQLLMHQGYEPRAVDVVDVRRICARFGIQPPPSFESGAPGP
jgi:lincosamide nucleotidyltransferase A/C/D/E